MRMWNQIDLFRSALLSGVVMASLGCVADLEDPAEVGQEVSVLAIPAPPASIFKETHECYGWYTVSWTSSPGATSYELHKGSTTTTRVYSGTSTSTSVNVGTQSGYFRAKACNSEGCSGFSPGISVLPWRTCN